MQKKRALVVIGLIICMTSYAIEPRPINIYRIINHPQGLKYTGKDFVEKYMPEYDYLFKQMDDHLSSYIPRIQVLLDEAKIVQDSKNKELKQESIITPIGQKQKTLEQLYDHHFVQHWKLHLKEAQKIRELMRTERYKQDITMHIDRYLQFLKRPAFNNDIRAELPFVLEQLEEVFIMDSNLVRKKQPELVGPVPVGTLGALRYRVRQKYPELFGPVPKLVPVGAGGAIKRMVFDEK